MTTILYVQINVMCIATLLLLYFNDWRSGAASLDERLYRFLLIGAMTMLLLDTGMWVFDRQVFAMAKALNVAVTFLYYLIMPALSYIWLIYCEYMAAGESHNNKRIRYIIKSIPLLISSCLTVVSIWTGWFFSVDESNSYIRGPLYLLCMLIMIMYYVRATYITLRVAKHKKNKTEKRKYLTMAAFMIPPLAGGIIQSFFFGSSLVWCCLTFSLLMLFINVQNRQIFTDALTGVNNRRRIDSYLIWKTASMESGFRLYGIMIDVDRFKHINDTYGHAVGDSALVETARILKRVCDGKNDFLARTGGDEFIIVCQRLNDSGVLEIIEAINKELEESNRTSKQEYTLSLSMGYAVFGDKNTGTIDSFLTAADRKMYSAKAAKIDLNLAGAKPD